MSTTVCKKCSRVNQIPEEDTSETVSYLRAIKEFSIAFNGQTVTLRQSGVIAGAIVAVLVNGDFPVVPLKEHDFIICACGQITHLKPILV